MKYLLCDAHDSRFAFTNVTTICDSAFLRTYNIIIITIVTFRKYCAMVQCMVV